MYRHTCTLLQLLLLSMLSLLPAGLLFSTAMSASPDMAALSSRLQAASSTPSFIMASCDGSLGRCDLDSELLMDSEINRRVLAGTSGYISYGALTANRVPCSTAGRSYYNCRTSGPANPYTRGCSVITRCLRDTS